MGIFNYELRQNVDLKFEVDPDLVMVGYDVKLFQLWSNLIKNAFEAMEDQVEKYIGNIQWSCDIIIGKRSIVNHRQIFPLCSLRTIFKVGIN